MVGAATAERATTAVAARESGFRPDIEGLRAVAIGLVLLYHGGVDQLTGGFVGVDVFFVISGFLITGLLIRELERSGRISLRRFYARRAKRLLPATAVVLVATALLTWATISIIDWRTFGGDIVSAALYVINWRLAERSVDYLAEDVGLSPVQHFWSLAVEEQFYILWPLLLVAIAWWARSRGGPRRRVLGIGILLITLPSLAYSIYLTQTDAAIAFFITPTRLWELGIGAMVAIGSHLWTRVPRTGAAVLGWAGLATIAASALAFSAATPWPGHHALAPTLGTAAVIIAGSTAGRAGPGRLLSWRPAVWIGGLSYSLYLWHWPLLIAATALWGELGTKRGLLLMLASFIPAYLCHRYIENPIRYAPSVSASNRYALSLGATFTLIGVTAGLLLALAVPPRPAAPAQSDAAPGQNTPLGATALTTQPTPTTGGDGTTESLTTITWYTPDAIDATSDLPTQRCAAGLRSAEVEICEYGDLDSDTVIAVVGDSKIEQWTSALTSIAEERGWRLVVYLKSACPFADAVRVVDGEMFESCVEWNAAVRSEVEALAPDLVVTSQRTREALEDPGDIDSLSEDAMVEGLTARWRSLVDNSIDVAVVLDNPAPTIGEVYECVAENPDDLERCTFDRDGAISISAAPVQLAAAAQVPEAHVIDMTDTICPQEQCVPIIGNVLIYRQGSHITDTYIRTATAALAEQLVPIVEGR